MAAERQETSDFQGLEITVDSCNLPVSGLSSLLRVVQAALREVARGDEATREQLSERPQPTLHLSATTDEANLTFRLTFADPTDRTPLLDLSTTTFRAFLSQLRRFVEKIPQRDLWGDAVGGPGRGESHSEAEKRIDQVRQELRRLPKAKLTFEGQSITFEGDRMEIG